MADLLAMFNALLNGTSALCLVSGWWAIRHKKVARHRFLMVSAFLLSVLFLISYLTRFCLSGVHRFPHEGMVRQIYFIILISHTLLASLVPFLALRTLFLAIKKRFPEHRRWARITFPIWLYVSVTGVVVYLMLYQGTKLGFS